VFPRAERTRVRCIGLHGTPAYTPMWNV
jgi:hypothetical protein